MAQAEGYYPRINAAMLQSGQYNMIVAFMGRIQNTNLAGGTVDFLTSDGSTVTMDVSQAELPETLDMPMDERPIMEAIGQVVDGNVVLFITRELTSDTNMEVYDKMLGVQHNPKFASYFTPVAGAMAMGSQMIIPPFIN